MTIDDQIRSFCAIEVGNTLARIPDKTPWSGILSVSTIIAVIGMAYFNGADKRKVDDRLDRLESRSVSEITVIHPDRRLERVVEPWGGAL